MKKSEHASQSTLSQADSLDEIATFWDDHSLSDFWDMTREVSFDVRAERVRRIPLDPELYCQVESNARSRGLSPETLVNMWVAERLNLLKTSHG
ncbi:CopG family antitoxin [Desulfonatronum thioautotrophicum]|uniref:CopG family antitoxin n=1 Tax=Desulfonatronum thioautotrophicum TaxID=617001 RepID=UPI0009FC6CF3|nr:CopG family antitoxin [Desulfonatronum thioautotrophicum]